MTTRREKVLAILFPRQQGDEESGSLRYDETSQRYVSGRSIDTSVLSREGSEKLTCTICLDKIGETQGVSGACSHVCKSCGLFCGCLSHLSQPVLNFADRPLRLHNGLDETRSRRLPAVPSKLMGPRGI